MELLDVYPGELQRKIPSSEGQVSRQMFLKLLQDRLFHFIVFVASLFMVYVVVKGPDSLPANRTVVDETQSRRLQEQFQRTWIRQPATNELLGVAEDSVKEEILYHEARTLGHDQDDLAGINTLINPHERILFNEKNNLYRYYCRNEPMLRSAIHGATRRNRCVPG